ncbi:MAG: OmpA family protein [Pseudomonadota bacterium]
MKLIQHVGALSAISCALLASQAAQAADAPFVNPDWANSAWYIGAGIGASQATIDQPRIQSALIANGSTMTSFSKDERDGPAFKLLVGKQLNRYLALEAGYVDLGKFGFNAVTSDGTLNGQAGFRGVNLDLLGQMPLTERFSLLARVGANYVRSNTHFTGNRLNAVTAPNATQKKAGLKLGLGMEYKLSEALAMRGELERHRVNDAVGNRGDVDMLSFGLVYKLGRPAARAPVYVAPPEPQAAAPAPAPLPPPVAPPAPMPTTEKVTFASETLFDFDKSVVKPEGKAAIDALLDKLAGMNTEVMVTVGHADAIGSDDYNQKLSQRRAEAVKAYIVAKGIADSRVFTEGKGESQPVADNKTAEGRAKNRRVTVEVVGTRSVNK